MNEARIFFYLCAANGWMCSFCCGNNFVMQMIFSVDMLNTKVVDNLHILLALKFHDLQIPYQLLLVVYAVLQRYTCLSKLTCESSLEDK
jgi:hypothetical protein